MNHIRRLFGNRIFWLQAVTISLLLLPIVGAGLAVWVKHKAIQDQIAVLEPRYARLLGMLERKAEIKLMAQLTAEQLARVAYPATQDVTQAGNDAQQRIRATFADSKLNVISIQVLPAKEEGQFERIPIDLRVEGDLTGVQNAMTLLAAQTPLVVTEDLALQTVGAVLPASTQRLAGQFSFSVWRVRP